MTQEIIGQNIIDGYISGESELALSRRFETNTRRIHKILVDNNIEKISRAKRLNPNYDENYFEAIDSPEKAYWLGWILTDGGVTEKSGLEISLQKRDAYILELFQADIGIDNHIKTFNGEYMRFSFACKKLLQDLSKYGIVPNKTLTLKYPKNIPQEYEIHMLRGMFEGDGGLTVGMATRYYKDKNKTYTKPYQELSMTGTYDICKNFHDKLKQYSTFSDKNIGKNHSIYRVRWSNADEIINIFHALYDDCGEHYMKRKYNKFKEVEMRVKHQ